MVVGILELKIVIRDARSLKDKRRVIKSLKDRIRNDFNVSIAEVGDMEFGPLPDHPFRLADHRGAHIHSHHLGTAVEQPLGIASRPAARIQHALPGYMRKHRKSGRHLVMGILGLLIHERRVPLGQLLVGM